MGKYNKGFPFQLCVIGIFSKYAWITAFQKFLDKSNRKPNKIRVDKAMNCRLDQWNHGCKIMT